jgi:outer membrane immunogenic protein
MKKYLIAGLLAAGIAAPALAQDAGADNGRFTGFRVEGLAGYDRVNADGHSDGVTYGAGVGYDFQAGNMVVGIEGEAADSTVDECVSGTVTIADSLCVKAGRDLYAGGRIGAVVGSNTLLYAKAGYTNARVNSDYEDGTAGTAADFNLHQNLDGIRAGVGAEFGVGSNAFIKAEYRYSNYEQGIERHQGVVGVGLRF